MNESNQDNSAADGTAMDDTAAETSDGHSAADDAAVVRLAVDNLMVDRGGDDEAPEGLLEAFWTHERALHDNDLDELDRLLARSPHTIFGDASAILRGHDAISTFRQNSPAANPGIVSALGVRRTGDDSAVIVASTVQASGGYGQRFQLWRRISGEWAIEVAQASVAPPAIAASTWRIVGSPLVAGSNDGPLAGATVAVKDIFAVAGFATGAGVPEFLAESPRASANAIAVTALLAAGASVQGISTTDEFAFSIAGHNSHYGTPPNGAVPGAIPGGSSSGSASAVATGQVTVGLGSDTAGSIRIPASYQGLWGLRTTHGSIDTSGLQMLAPSFDTIGWMTRDAATLAAAAAVSLAGAPVAPAEPHFAIATGVADHASEEVKDAFDSTIDRLTAAGLLDDLDRIELPDLADLYEIFHTIQSAEAWRGRGEWIDAHPDALAEEVADRFRFGATIDAETEGFAHLALGLARERIASVLGDRILILPSASSVAPALHADAETLEELRSNTLRLTSIAGIAGRPALSMPVMQVGSAPVGLCLIGPANSDLALIELGSSLAAAL